MIQSRSADYPVGAVAGSGYPVVAAVFDPEADRSPGVVRSFG